MRSPDLMSVLLSIYGTSNVVPILPAVPYTKSINKCFFYVDGKKLMFYYEFKEEVVIVKIIDQNLVFTVTYDITLAAILKIETSMLQYELENVVKSLSGGENRESFFDS